MNRLYVIEPAADPRGPPPPTIGSPSRRATSPSRKHRRRRKSGARPPGGSASTTLPARLARHASWIKALARDLAAHRGKSLVLAGETQPAEVHALAHLINDALGNVGKTVDFIARVDAGPPTRSRRSCPELAKDAGGRSETRDEFWEGTRFMTRLADLDFADSLKQQARSSCASIWASTPTRRPSSATGISPRPIASSRGATSRPTTERPRSSSRLIAPLYKGRSTGHEVPGRAAGRAQIYRAWKSFATTGGGDLAGISSRAKARPSRTGSDRRHASRRAKPVSPNAKEIAMPPKRRPRTEVRTRPGNRLLRPDPTIGDGRWANNGWLQELPRLRCTKLAWGNAAHPAPGAWQAAGHRKRRHRGVCVIRASSVRSPPGPMPRGRRRDR